MSSPAPFQPIADLLERGLSIRNVYGDPVTQGDVTVIPVAQVTCAFGAGGGTGLDGGRSRKAPAEPRRPSPLPEVQGAGGGGALRMTPLGALEIGPEGTRFISYPRVGPLLIGAGIGLAVGVLLATRRGIVGRP